jgi:Ca2+-binding EF-hand superfamily protein
MSRELKSTLEKQLREKINQKANDKLSDEAYVIKSMKFFDIYNTGNLTYDQFHKALEKMGVYYTFEEIAPIVQTYDSEGHGKIDYVEFSKYLFNSTVLKPHQRKLSPEEMRMETGELLEYFKKRLSERAGNGLISLRRIFNIIDTDKSGTISQGEFSGILKEFKIELSNQQIDLIFKIFDLNRDGQLTYEEFLAGIRGQMNEFRIFLVSKVFDKLDTLNSGFVEFNAMVSQYDPTRHPAVVE